MFSCHYFKPYWGFNNFVIIFPITLIFYTVILISLYKSIIEYSKPILKRFPVTGVQKKLLFWKISLWGTNGRTDGHKKFWSLMFVNMTHVSIITVRYIVSEIYTDRQAKYIYRYIWLWTVIRIKYLKNRNVEIMT